MIIDFDKDIPSGKIWVRFERWKKAFNYEYRSGFAYSPDTAGELNVQHIISQKELSTSGWYYYEEDYNEWRNRKYPY